MYANRFLTQSRKGAEKRRGLSFLLCATLRLCVSALIFSASTAFGQSITATKAYVDRRYTEATNAVPSIVTNEVSGWDWEWGRGLNGRFRVDSDLIYRGDGEWIVALWDLVEDRDVWPIGSGQGDATRVDFSDFGVAVRKSRNALGLAMAKDLEKLPTHETVTNVARSVVNSVWDASLGVAWEARMHNGHLYYIAVTNKPPEVK
jgi:hypothetical protein